MNIRLFSCDCNHQTKEITAQIGTLVHFVGHLVGNICTLHAINTQTDCRITQFLRIYTGSNNFFVHAVRYPHDIFRRCLTHLAQINFNIRQILHQCQISRHKLKIICRDFIAFFDILLHQMHGKRMNNHAIVNLNHKILAFEQMWRPFCQQRTGKRHKAAGITKCLF